MKRKLVVTLLVGANLALAALLISTLSARRNDDSSSTVDTAGGPQPKPVPDSGPEMATRSRAPVPYAPKAPAPLPATVFTRVYSEDAKTFAANLRAINCPEQTVRDIVVAEIGRRFRAQTEALRPKPADHVPFTWSAQTSEAKLLQRRQQAATMAREETALLREALGYELPVQMQNYAMTSSEQRFDDELAASAPDVRGKMRQAHELYWSKVQTLQDRTKGFWQSEDVAELERLKQDRQQTIKRLVSGP